MAIVTLVGYFLQEEQVVSEGNVTLVVESIGKTTVEEFDLDGMIVLDLLKNNHEVINDYFVKCIDDVCADGKYSWLFYVNEEVVSEGVQRYEVNRGDKIEFRFKN